MSEVRQGAHGMGCKDKSKGSYTISMGPLDKRAHAAAAGNVFSP